MPAKVETVYTIVWPDGLRRGTVSRPIAKAAERCGLRVEKESWEDEMPAKVKREKPFIRWMWQWKTARKTLSFLTFPTKKECEFGRASSGRAVKVEIRKVKGAKGK